MGICDECIIKDGCKFANSGLIMTHCKNFIGEAPREIKTNFQRITASPEALAEFIAKSINDTIKLTNGNRKYTERIVQKEFWLKWLKQESDTE